jgi:hypothetical protein
VIEYKLHTGAHLLGWCATETCNEIWPASTLNCTLQRDQLRFFGSTGWLDDIGMEQTLRIHVAGHVYSLIDKQFWA